MPDIHSTAVVSPDSEIADDVRIGPFAVVEAGAKLASGCVLEAHSIVRSGSDLGESVFVDSFAVVGGLPQDFKFDRSMPSGVKIGAHSQLREHVTVHRSTREHAYTELGESVFLMAGAHVAHDCKVGDHAILANNVLLAGEVQVGRYSFLGGGAVIHQFVRIGESVMMSGNAAMSREVPPYLMVANRNSAYGLNLIGMKRRGFSTETISEIKRCYKRVFLREGVPARHAEAALKEGIVSDPRALAFLEFFGAGRVKRYVVARKQGGEGV